MIGIGNNLKRNRLMNNLSLKEAGKKLKQMGYYYILDMGGISNWPYEKEYPQNSN